MSTFIGQLVGFAVIVFLLWKYVVPPVRTMMKNQQDTVRTQLAEHAEAEKKVADADKEHAKALEEAKAEAERGDRGGAAGRGEDRRAASGPGRRRAGAHQGAGRTTGPAAASAADPRAAADSRHRIGPSRRRFGPRLCLRSRRAGGDGGPLPRRARRDGTVDRGLRRHRRRRNCVPPAATDSLAWSRSSTRSAADLDVDQIDPAGRSVRVGGQDCWTRRRCWPGIWPTRQAIPPPRSASSSPCCPARFPMPRWTYSRPP